MLLKLTEQQFHHILAGLRALEANPEPFIGIATNEGEVPALTVEDLDQLAQQLNDGDLTPTRLDQVVEDLKGQADDPFIHAARELWANDECEIDDIAIVSEGDDGAFVSAWVWVSNSEAGIETCSECGAKLDEAGDGYDGLCATCADVADPGAE